MAIFNSKLIVYQRVISLAYSVSPLRARAQSAKKVDRFYTKPGALGVFDIAVMVAGSLWRSDFPHLGSVVYHPYRTHIPLMI